MLHVFWQDGLGTAACVGASRPRRRSTSSGSPTCVAKIRTDLRFIVQRFTNGGNTAVWA